MAPAGIMPLLCSCCMACCICSMACMLAGSIALLIVSGFISCSLHRRRIAQPKLSIPHLTTSGFHAIGAALQLQGEWLPLSMPYCAYAYGPYLIVGSRSSICLIWGLAAAAASTEERIISGLLSICCMAACHMGFCKARTTVSHRCHLWGIFNAP